MLNVLPETAGRVSVHVSARLRVSTWKGNFLPLYESACVPMCLHKRRPKPLGGAAYVLMRDVGVDEVMEERLSSVQQHH